MILIRYILDFIITCEESNPMFASSSPIQTHMDLGYHLGLRFFSGLIPRMPESFEYLAEIVQTGRPVVERQVERQKIEDVGYVYLIRDNKILFGNYSSDPNQVYEIPVKLLDERTNKIQPGDYYVYRENNVVNLYSRLS
jgi:hypothetical protein